MNERYAELLRRARHRARAIAIDGEGLGRFLLGLVDSRVGRGIDDDIGLRRGDRGLHGRRVFEIELGPANGDDRDIGPSPMHKRCGHLAMPPRDHKPDHHLPTPRRSPP